MIELEPQDEPVARLGHAVGAVQSDPQAFDAARREIDRKDEVDRQQVASIGGQHCVNFTADTISDLVRPGLEHQTDDVVGDFIGSEETRERTKDDQERKQGHQSRERDVARDRPTIIGVEPMKRGDGGAEAHEDQAHGGPSLVCNRRQRIFPKKASPARRARPFLAGKCDRKTKLTARLCVLKCALVRCSTTSQHGTAGPFDEVRDAFDPP